MLSTARAAVALSVALGGCTASVAPETASNPTAPWRAAAWQPEPISSPAFESHAAFDGSSLYFVRSSPAFTGWRILVSDCRGGRWSGPRDAAFAADGVEADPFLTRDGKSLYFISSRSEGGVKQIDLDIWRVDRGGSGGEWGTPLRLPEPINSAGNEWFPRPAADGWLYFGSDRPGGMGKTDIYRARQKQGRWHVENLGPTVNGPGDEYEAEISPDGRRMILMADGDLYLVEATAAAWGTRQKMGPEINTPGLEVGPAFSPSGRSFTFARDFGKTALPLGGSGELVTATTGAAEKWPRPCA